MMGSVLSILDPLEPMTALAGDRRLHMTTNLLAGPGKHLDHYLHHPLRAWSWTASGRNAQLADARRAQQQVRSGEQTSRRPANAEVFACSPAVKSAAAAPTTTTTTTTSRRAAHAQDESAAAAAAVAQRKLQTQAQRSLLKVQRAEGHPDDEAGAGDPAASGQEDQQRPPATRLQQHKDQQQQQRNKGSSSGHEMVAGAGLAAQAAPTTMSNKTQQQQQQMKTITTQVACSANIGQQQQRGQHQRQHLQLDHHQQQLDHQLNQTQTSSVQNNPNSQSQQQTTNSQNPIHPPTPQTLADQASNQAGKLTTTKRAHQQQQEADHHQQQQSDADESNSVAAKMTQLPIISQHQQQQIYAHEHQKNLLKPSKHQQSNNQNNNHNQNNNSNKRAANQKQRDSLCNANQPSQARATNSNTSTKNNSNNNSRRQQQQPTATSKGRKRSSNQQVNGAHKSAAKASHGQQQQQQQVIQANQQQKWHRDHRSLSTSSSLGSSGSSSPSSSMLQIFSPRELQRQRHRRNQQQQQQQQARINNNNNNQHLSANTRPNSSSASSTISSLSTAGGCDPKPMILCPSPQQHQILQIPFITQASIPVVDNQQRGAALWALAGQQPQLVLCPGLGEVCQQPTAAFYPAPPPRPWLQQQQQQQQQQQRQTIDPPLKPSTKPSPVREPEFTVISYNVLCDRMVSNEMFPSSPDIALNWFYRRELILRQLLEFDADIIALQELELEQFETYFRPELNHFGSYEAIFEPKSRARTMDNHKRKRVDGCAIFYKSHKFRLIQRHLLEFSQIALANAQGSEAMINRVMTKDNIGLAAVLEFIQPQVVASDGSLDSGGDDDDDADTTTTTNANNKCPASSQQLNKLPAAKRNLQRATSHFERNYHQASSLLDTTGGAHHQRLLVCNTHIHWDPECCDVKLVQTIMLMNELECIARHYATCNPLPPTAPIVIKNHHLDLDPRLTQHNNNNNKLSGPNQPAPILPLVLLGDFNSMPNSGVASYLTAGKINSLHKDFKSFRYTSCTNALALQHQYYNHQQNSGDTNNNGTRNSGSSSSISSNSLSPSHLINANYRRQSSPAWCVYPTNNNNNNIKEPSACSSISSSPSTSSSSPYSSSPPTSSSSPITQQQQQHQTHYQNSRSNKPAATRDIAESQTKASSAHHHHHHQQQQQQQQAKQILNYNHPFNLASAYEKDTMPYTNYTDKFKAIIDYIFYSSDSIQLLGLLGPLDKNWLKGNRIKGLPQPHLPSDHLPLLVKLRLTAPPETGTSLIEQWPMQTSTLATTTITNSSSRPDLSHDLYDDQAIIITKPQYSHHHTNYPHKQQQQQPSPPQITPDHHDYLLGRVRQRQQPQLCKSQTVRVNTKNSRVKHEQIRS